VAALRELLVQFTTAFDTTALENGERKVESVTGKLRQLGTALVSALAVSKIKDFVFGLADQADALRDQSRMLGMGIDDLQAWQHAAEKSGVAAEEFTASFVKFQRNIAEAAEGTGPAAEAFKALGVQVKDGAGRFVESGILLDGVAEGISKIQDPAKRTALAMDLFGRSGAKLLPLFAEGPEGIRMLREEMGELGGGITEDFAEASDELNDNLKDLDKVILSIKVRIAGFLVPAFSSAIGWLTRAGAAFNRLARDTGILQSALVVLGAVSTVKIGQVLLGLFANPKLLIAIAAIIAAIIAVNEVMTFFQGGETMLGRALDATFGPGTQEKVRAFFKEVGDGLDQMSTDANTNSEEFRANWAATLDDVRNDFDGTFGEFFGGIMAGAVDTFFVFVNGISGGWASTIEMFMALAEGLVFTFQVVWNDIQGMAEAAAAGILDAFNAVGQGISKALGAVGIDTGIPASTDPSFGDLAKGRRQKREGDLYAKAQGIDNRLRGPNREARAREALGMKPGDGDRGTGRRVGERGEFDSNTLRVAPGTLSAPRERFALAGAGAGGGSTTINAPVNMTVNVPPGTPRQVGESIGRVGATGVNRAAAAGFAKFGKKGG